MDQLIEDDFTGVNQGALYPNTPVKFLTATSIIGDKVHDEGDIPMGKIEDIMLDVTCGEIHYVVVEFGGFLGIGVKYFAIPFSLLELNPEKKLFIFKGKKSMLEKAPGFDLSHWPDTNFHDEQRYWHFVD